MKSVDLAELVAVGKSMGTHGYRGALKLFVEARYLESLFTARAVFFDLDGVMVPLLVVEIERRGDQAVVSFRSKDSEQKIKTYVNREILLHQDDLVHFSDETRHPWYGFVLKDQSGNQIARLIDLVEDEYQQIATLELGEEHRRIPLPDEWITAIDEDLQVLHVDLPAGLLDI